MVYITRTENGAALTAVVGTTEDSPLQRVCFGNFECHCPEENGHGFGNYCMDIASPMSKGQDDKFVKSGG